MSDGVVVEASIVARLLGLKLLRLRADVVLAPARLEPTTIVEEHRILPGTPNPDGSGAPTPIRAAHEGTLRDAIMLLEHARGTLRDS